MHAAIGARRDQEVASIDELQRENWLRWPKLRWTKERARRFPVGSVQVGERSA
jgi:hypothetical protein